MGCAASQREEKINRSTKIQEILTRIDLLKKRIQREHLQRLSNAQDYILRAEQNTAKLDSSFHAFADQLEIAFHARIMPILDGYEQQLDELEGTAKKISYPP